MAESMEGTMDLGKMETKDAGAGSSLGSSILP